MTSARIIYDLGSNNGDDIPYYLKKGEVVVAVEANPTLCAHILERFPREVAERRLFVENCIVTADDLSAEVTYFYVNKRAHVLSQFPEPPASRLAEFERIALPSRSVVSLVSQYGAPYYVKIDIEHYDEPILRALFANGIRPPYISAESHEVGVFAAMVALGGYNAFKLVDGLSVAERYRQHSIRALDGIEQYSFPPHSAGPFGDDVLGEWLTADAFLRVLAFENLGWKDIHATNVAAPNARARVRLRDLLTSLIKREVRYRLPKVARAT